MSVESGRELEKSQSVLVTQAVGDVLGLGEVTWKERSGISLSFFFSLQRNGSRWRCMFSR